MGSASLRRATVFVGDTCNDEDEETPTDVRVLVGFMVSLALPPIAFGTVFDVDL